MPLHYALSRTEYEKEVDVTLAGSFPASDPPSWTFGASPWMAVGTAMVERPVAAAGDVVIAGGSHRLGGIRLASIGEAIGLTAALPLGILLVGVPIVALVWVIANAFAMLTGTN